MFKIANIIVLICICSFAASQQSGYNVSGSFGSIQSPNYPDLYDSNLNCYYSLTTLKDTFMVLDIVDLDLYDSSDNLYIYDGPSTDDELIVKYSGHITSTNVVVNASSNHVLVRFSTSVYDAGRGFNITFHTSVCSNDVTATSGIIQSPLYPEPYFENLDCYNRFTTSENTAVTLFIEHLDLESCCDFLKVYDGPTSNSKILGVYTGRIFNFSVTATSNQVLLYLHTDLSNEYGGYNIHFTESEQCLEEVSAPYGSIVSQGYPVEPYGNFLDCYYKVTTSSDTAISFNVVDMSLEEIYDYVEIYEGNTTSGAMVGKFTGVQSGVYANVSTNEAMIHFHTDSSGQSTGFYIYFEEIETENCPANNYLDKSGILPSPLDQGLYPNNVDCYYNVHTYDYSQISLHVNSLDVELSIDCAKDFVEIFDGPTTSSPLLAKYCGKGPVNDIISSTNQLLAHFHSDRETAGSGFNISYNTNPCVDPAEYYGDSGTIYSPGFPSSNYPTSIDCKYAIATPAGSTVQLTVTHMNVEYAPFCQFDFVRIYDGPDENYPLIEILCGNHTFTDIQTSTNKILVNFHSDLSITYEGFSIVYTASYLGDEIEEMIATN